MLGHLQWAFDDFLTEFAKAPVHYTNWHIRHLDEFASRFTDELKPEQYFTFDSVELFLKEVNDDWLKDADEEDKESFNLTFDKEECKKAMNKYLKDMMKTINSWDVCS